MKGAPATFEGDTGDRVPEAAIAGPRSVARSALACLVPAALLLLPSCAAEHATAAPASPAPVATVTAGAPAASAAPVATAPAGAPASSTTPAPNDAEPSVQVGTVADKLGDARVPFARYLIQVHERLHPAFSDAFLGSLEKLPRSHPMNQDGLQTTVELAIDHRTGSIVRMVIVKTSGVTAFDVGVLDAVIRAQPFGPAPDIIASPDGNVYVHWSFYRDPRDGCQLRNVRPYILKRR
ncbi:Hypothetical protein A7982_04646 [Minicystis rosea]|nr:Hypothetical protein A7982_04646 [Minicystis rosea]